MTERTVLRVMVVIVCSLAAIGGVEAGNSGLKEVQLERRQATNRKQLGEMARVLLARVLLARETGEGNSSTSDGDGDGDECTLCSDGSDASNLLNGSLPPDDSGDVTSCSDVSSFVSIFRQSDALCHDLQRDAAAPCGCPPPALPVVAEGFCTLCHNGTAPLEGTDLNMQLRLDNDSDDMAPEYTCTDFAYIIASFLAQQPECAVAQYAVASDCGCDPPPLPSGDALCTLCADGSPPRSPDANISNSDYYSEQTTSCIDAAFSFAIFPPDSIRCKESQALVAQTCGCPDPVIPTGTNVCTLCTNGTDPTNINASLPPDEHGDSITCREFSIAMSGISNDSADCMALRYQAAAPCGCPIPSLPSDDSSYCTLCANGQTPTVHLHNTTLPPDMYGDVMTCEEFAFDLLSYHPRDGNCTTAQILVANTCGCPLPAFPQHDPICDLCSGDELPSPNYKPYAHVASYDEAEEMVEETMTCGELQLLAAYDDTDFADEQFCRATQATIGRLCHCPNPPQPQCAISCSKEGYSVNMSAVPEGFSYLSDFSNVEGGRQQLCADLLFEMSLDTPLCDTAKSEVQEACCFPTQEFDSSFNTLSSTDNTSSTSKVPGAIVLIAILAVVLIVIGTSILVWKKVVARKKASSYIEVTFHHDDSSSLQ